MELRGQSRSQIEFGNEGKAAIVLRAFPALFLAPGKMARSFDFGSGMLGGKRQRPGSPSLRMTEL